jgi:hypothetical protein
VEVEVEEAVEEGAAAKVEMVLERQGSQVLQEAPEVRVEPLAGSMLLGALCSQVRAHLMVRQLQQPALVAAVGMVLNDPGRAKSRSEAHGHFHRHSGLQFPL